jgi:hypothetical protein
MFDSFAGEGPFESNSIQEAKQCHSRENLAIVVGRDEN